MLLTGLSHLGAAFYHQRRFAEAREKHFLCRELAGDWEEFSSENKQR
jgi:hypothetical protein